MSEALERVIAQQQKEIDRLQNLNESYRNSLEVNFKKEEKIFETCGTLADATVCKEWTKESWDEYHRLKNAARLAIMEAGYCLRCMNFICECDNE